MPFLTDVRNASALAWKAFGSWRARGTVAAFVAAHPWPTAEQAEIVVHFPDAPVNLYQLRQWYRPLAELAKHHPVVVVVRSPLTMVALAKECPVPLAYARKIVDIETFFETRSPKIVFYVNQNTKNFSVLRFSRMWHVFINHGESDKSYMTSNQFKSYDFAFVAGDAALERLGARLWNYDVSERAIPIGRPQTDHFDSAPPFEPDDRTVVLYAPTWEGDRESMRYGSIATHGEALVTALLGTGRHRVVYRPHPRSGVTDPAYAAANKRIVAALTAANARDPRGQHVYDTGADLSWQLAAADVAITDISAMVYDRLATGKPLLVTRPASSSADVDETGYLGACEWLTASDAPAVVEHVDRVLTSDEAHQTLAFWVERHFGDTSPGAATARFHAAIETLIGRWEELAASSPR